MVAVNTKNWVTPNENRGYRYRRQVDDSTMDLLKALDPWNHSKSEDDRLKAVQEAVEKGADIVVQDYRTKVHDKKIKSELPSNNTPLHITVLKKYRKVFAFLIKKLKEGPGIETALEKINNKNETVLKLIRDQKNKNILQGIDLDEEIIKEINQMLNMPEQKSEAAIRNEKADKYEDLVFCLVERTGREKFPNSYFSIGREIKTRETDDQKFDDTVFSYKQNGNKYIIPIQVKHKGENKKINHHDLSDYVCEFSVPKYFLSYLDLRNDINKITDESPSHTGHNKENENKKYFKDGKIQHIVIFTSASVDTEQLRQANFELKDAPKGVIDIFDLSSGTREPNYKQLEAISDELKDRLLKTFSEFEKKNGQQQSLTEAQRQDEIKSFLNRLVFIINQPKVEDLEWRLSDLTRRDIFKDTPFETILGDATFEQYKKNLEKDLSKKGGRPSGWIDGEKATNYFQEQAHQVQTSLIVAGMAVMYNKKILGYGAFENLNTLTELDKFLDGDSGRVLCIQTSKTLLSSIKLLQYLNTKEQYTLENCGRISVTLEEILQSNQHREAIVEAFEHSNTNLLTIECKDEVYNQESITHLYQALSSIIQENSNKKKIILVTQKDKPNALAEQFKDKLKNTEQYVPILDAIDIRNFEPKENPLEKEISLGQKKTSLAKLTGINTWKIYLSTLPDDDQPRQERILADLITNREIQIGSKPLDITDLEGAYAELLEEVNKNTLKTDLVTNSPEVIYIISRINTEGQSNPNEAFINDLGLETGSNVNDKINILLPPYSIPSTDKTIQLVDSGFEESDFKDLCDSHSDKKVYWIKWNESKFTLQEIYNPDFYLTRDFNKVVIRKVEQDRGANAKQGIKAELEKADFSERFIFSNVNNREEFIRSFGFTTAERQQFESNCQNNKIILLSSAENPKDIFQSPSSVQSQAVHWLDVEGSQLIWRDSKGSLDNLSKCIDKEQSKISLEAQDSLLQFIKDKKVVIIADDPGMGKSTTLVKLYQSKYADNESKLVDSHWVINVNLRDHLKAIKEIDSSAINIPGFLSKVDKNLKDDLAPIFLKFALENKSFSKPLLITFDGFDEVLDEKDRNKVIELLKFLKNKTNAKFWITTRLQHQPQLENDLSTFAVTFKSLDEGAQKIFIKKFFRNRLSLLLSKEKFTEIFGDSDEVEDGTRMSQYTEAFIENMQSVFKGDVSRFIGTPLQLYLLLGSKVSLEAIKNWAESRSDSVPTFDYLGKNILEVYKNFIDGKYETYFKKVGIVQETAKKEKRFLFKKYCKELAKVNRKIGRSASESKLLKKHKDIALSVGLIKSDGDRLDFIHPTFEEYFASAIYMHWIEKESDLLNLNKQEKLLKEILMNNNDYVIRSFINLRLEKTKIPDENLKQYGEIFKKLWQQQPNPLIRQEGGTILHIAVREQNKQIINFVIDSLDKTSQSQQNLYKLLKIIDKGGQTALHICSLEFYEEITSSILKVAEKLSPEQLYNLLKIKDEEGKTVLHYASFADIQYAGNFKDSILDDLVLKTAAEKLLPGHLYNLLKIQDGEGKTVLHYVSITVADTEFNTDSFQESILDNAVFQTAANRLSPEQLYNLLKIQDGDRKTILHYVSVVNIDYADAGNFQQNILADLVFQTAANKLSSTQLYDLLKIQDEEGKTALHYASENRIDIANLIGDKKELLLVIAAQEHNQDFIDLFHSQLEEERLHSPSSRSASLESMVSAIENLYLTPSPEPGCISSSSSNRRRKRDICIENESDDLFPYEPLQENIEQPARANARLYSNIAYLFSLQGLDNIPANIQPNNIINYNRNIGDILSEGEVNHSDREEALLKNHYNDAVSFLSLYSKENLLEEGPVNLGDKHWLLDDGKHSLIVSHEGNHYKVYSQDYNYRVVFQTKDGIGFSDIEPFAKAFFRWRSGSSDYKIFTLSKNLPREAVDALKQAKFWHPDQVASDLMLLDKGSHIEQIPAKVVRELFFLDGQVPELTTLHKDFFSKYLGRISLRVEAMHNVLPSLTAQASSDLTGLINRYDFPIDKGYLNSIPDSNKDLLHAYHDKVQEQLKQGHTITAQDLSDLSWQILEEKMAEHPDISPELKESALKNVKDIHGSTRLHVMGAVTQTLFFLPDIVRSINNDDYQQLGRLGGMVGGDMAFNKLYGFTLSDDSKRIVSKYYIDGTIPFTLKDNVDTSSILFVNNKFFQGYNAYISGDTRNIQVKNIYTASPVTLYLKIKVT